MILEWVRDHELALWWMGTLSLVAFFGTLTIIPILVVQIPSDYFRRYKRERNRLRKPYSLLRLIGLLVKNFFGVVFIFAGLAMLVLPGQGIITILIGVMLVNFPGKLTLEQRLVQQPNVLRVINWMRAKAHKPALQISSRDLKGRKSKQTTP